MALYELSDVQIQNIRAFLDRVDLKGKEANSFVTILNNLSYPVSKIADQKKKK